MKIFGHRGASGLGLENSASSIQAAISAGVDAIEIDVRATKDNKLVLCHDKQTGRVSSISVSVKNHTLAQLQKIKLHNGQYFLSLADAIKTAGKTPLIIEGKDSNWAKPLSEFFKDTKTTRKYRVISYDRKELYSFSLLLPEVPVYALEHTSPLDVIRVAKLLNFDGVDINFWLLNPLTYFMARYYKQDMIVYTVNKPWMARFVRVLYPKVCITTDYPDKLQFLRIKHRN